MDDYEIPDVSGYRIENWSEEEREMWCGIYTPARRLQLGCESDLRRLGGLPYLDRVAWMAS